MKYTIFDIETDNLLDEVTLIHCLSFSIIENGISIDKGTITDYNEMIDFLTKQECLVGHHIVGYDIPVLELLLEINLDHCRKVDTLALSWYLYPFGASFKHGLEAWGDRLDFAKPKIDDWENLGLIQYIHRCESDVEINTRLFLKQYDYLFKLYPTLQEAERAVDYVTYKADCLKEQEEIGLTLDTYKCKQSKLDLEFIESEKTSFLVKVMPKTINKTAPKTMYKKDGNLSMAGQKWLSHLESLDLPLDTLTTYIDANPGSHTQLKEWLFSLGWEPETFKVSKATGKEIPQVSLPMGGGICESVKKLYDKEPALIQLEGLYVVQHRIGLFKSYLDNEKKGKVYATANGFTNTLRLQHRKPVVNLPGVHKYYGNEIRGCLTVPNDSYIMCGSDISGLEDNTKQHYIYYFDPQYVIDMRVPGFDPHIDIAVLGDLLTKEDEVFFKWYNAQEEDYVYTADEKARMKMIKPIRTQAKVVNFSATYGAGPAKIAATLGCSLEFAQILHNTYWERNKAVKQTAGACKVKTVYNQKWLYNPVSGLWMFLKADKDKFSTLNQSTGVYVFDTWVRNVRQMLKPLGIKISLQYHDEILLICKKERKEEVDAILRTAMIKANEQLQLNVKIDISVDWGTNYAECH